MKGIWLVGIVLLLLGPLRRRLLLPLLSGCWRVVLPLIVGGIVGHIIVGRFMPGAPEWMMIVGPVFAGLMLGGAIKQCLDDILGPPRGK